MTRLASASVSRASVIASPEAGGRRRMDDWQAKGRHPIGYSGLAARSCGSEAHALLTSSSARYRLRFGTDERDPAHPITVQLFRG